MKQIDFSDDRTLQNIIKTALPIVLAQILNLLYNIVDRIYIARIPGSGTQALGAVGLCFPIVILIVAFTNMYGSGGAPLFSIARGRGDKKEAKLLQNTSFYLLVITAVLLTVLLEAGACPILRVFGASDSAMVYAMPYIRIYLLGNIFSMIATGMNPFITAQGFSTTGMITVMIGALSNIILDPVFIFGFGLGVRGAAIATVLSQCLSAAFVLWFLTGKDAEYTIYRMSKKELPVAVKKTRDIVGLGMAAFIMQLTNCVVQISCNQVLVHTGGDLYVSIMTIVNSARQMFETPLLALSEGSSPVISFNYGAGKPDKVSESVRIMFLISFVYAGSLWLFIRIFPETVISIFTSDTTILKHTVPAFHLYFSTFVFMVFQHCGQTVFKSLGKKKHAIFFSLLRKAFIVVPLTYLLPYAFHMGTDGVFTAEPVSNVIGGLACFITMYITMFRRGGLTYTQKDSGKGKIDQQ